MKYIISDVVFRNMYVNEAKNDGSGGTFDFSNRVGWSESLVGRMFNKVFSFGSKNIHKILLERLKNNLQAEYMKGVLIALSKQGVAIEDVTDKSSLSVDVYIVNKSSNEKTNIPINKENKYITKIKDSNFNNYKIVIEKRYDYQVITPEIIDNPVDANKFTVIAGDKKVTFDVLLENESSQTLVHEQPINKKYDIFDEIIPIVDKQIELIKKEPKQLSMDTTATGVANTNVNNEIQLKQLEYIKSELVKMNKAIPTSDDKIIPDKEYYTKKSQEVNEIYNDKNTKKTEALNRYYKFIINRIHPDKYDISEKLNKKTIDDMVRLFKGLAEMGNVTTESFLITSIFESFITIVEDKYSSNSIVNEKYNFNDIINSGAKISPDAKKALDKFGKVKYDEFNIDYVIDSFNKYKKLKNIAVDSVNKEALKEIQLQAEWMYDTNKYGDKRSGIYTRVNWTLTEPDAMQLENIWKVKVAEAKKTFSPLFSDSNGNFPNSLDPLTLLKSDQAYINNMNKLPKSEYNKHSIIGGTPDRMMPLSVDESNGLDILTIVKNKGINNGEFGMFKISEPTSNKHYYLIILKLKNDIQNVHCYKILGIVDNESLLRDYNQLSPDAKKKEETISEIIKKYTFINSTTSVGGFTDTNVQSLNDMFFPEIDGVDGKSKNLSSVLYSQNDVISSSNMFRTFLKSSVLVNKNENILYVTTLNEMKTINKTIEYSQINKTMNTRFQLRIEDVVKLKQFSNKWKFVTQTSLKNIETVINNNEIITKVKTLLQTSITSR